MFANEVTEVVLDRLVVSMDLYEKAVQVTYYKEKGHVIY